MNARDAGPDRNAALLLRAAIGLAAVHFAPPSNAGTYLVSSRDVAFLLDGHVDVWSGWRHLDAADTQLIAQLLRSRQSEYADSEWTRRTLQAGLRDEAIPACELASDGDSDLVVSFTPGMAPRDYAIEALAELEQRTSVGRGLMPTAGAGQFHTSVRVLTATGVHQSIVEQRFSIPEHAVRNPPASAPVLSTSASVDEIVVPASELIELAAKLDAVRTGPAYRETHVRRLCERLHARDGVVTARGVLGLVAGDLRLLNAPTGVGKSVLVEVLACWMARRGLVITVIVPNNSDVLKLAKSIEDDLGALGVDGAVTALMSPSAVYKAMSKVADSRPSWDPKGEWAADRLGYGCALVAAAESDAAVDAWSPGSEPCTDLRATGDEAGRRRACPWRMSCGKFRLARAALDASVIVTSHANLHRGRLHLPVEDERGVSDRTTIEELVFRRSHLVVIDEIDTFQKSVIGQAARGLVLDRRASVRTPLHSLEAEFVQAAGKINRDVESSVRDMVHHSKFLASMYTAALAHGLIGTASTSSRWSLGRHWLVPRRWDGALTARLFGLADHEPLTEELIAGFRSLFPGGDEPQSGEPIEFAVTRDVLASVTEVGGGARRLETSRDRLDEALEPLIGDEQERARVIDRLLQRTILERLRLYLRQFVYDAPHLAGSGVPVASEIAETFGPYSRWRAHPNGPMGRLLFAFSQHVDPTGRQPARLDAAAFGGDPHVYTTTLGDITALCRAGTRRAVLGLSATAYFPQAPHHHVHIDPHWWVPDEDISDVTIQPAHVTDDREDSSRRLRVSGTDGARRDDALRLLAEKLWPSRLRGELERLAADDPDRCRVLLATTSYHGARMVAEGLLRAGVEPGRICLAVRPADAPAIGDAGEPGPSERTTWTQLAADRLEEFPDQPGADILIAPLARAERGINIIGVDDRSALGSIWLLVRPVPIIDEPTELIAHVNAHPLAADANDKALTDLALRPPDVLDDRKQSAGRYFEDIVTSLPYFRTMPKSVQLSITAEVMNGLIQLVGRARRGGTSATVHLADGAMVDPSAGPTFGALIRRLREHWTQTGELTRMRELYGATLEAFFRYADNEAQMHSTDEGALPC